MLSAIQCLCLVAVLTVFHKIISGSSILVSVNIFVLVHNKIMKFKYTTFDLAFLMPVSFGLLVCALLTAFYLSIP